jgi:uncharacterized protein (DUF433 family)
MADSSSIDPAAVREGVLLHVGRCCGPTGRRLPPSRADTVPGVGGTDTLSSWRSSGSPLTRTRWAACPCIRGLRIPVATVVAMVADGMSTAEITDELPDLAPEDVAEALRYAAEAVRERELPLRHSA